MRRRLGAQVARSGKHPNWAAPSPSPMPSSVTRSAPSSSSARTVSHRARRLVQPAHRGRTKGAHSGHEGIEAFSLHQFINNAKAAMLDDTGYSASAELCSEQTMQDLNHRYLGKNEPTDVLSFPSVPSTQLHGDKLINDSDDSWLYKLNCWWNARTFDRTDDNEKATRDDTAAVEDSAFLGDIAISEAHVVSQAEQQGHDTKVEAAVLLAHGVAHLMGEDHEDGEAEAAQMHEVEASLLEKCAKSGLIDITSGTASLTNRSTLVDLDPRSDNAHKSLNHPRYRNIVLDLDGTLLTSSQAVSFVDRDAVLDALNTGVRVFPATGKAPPSARARLREGGLGMLADEKSPGVFLQGLIVHGEDGEIVHQAFLPTKIARTVMEHDFGDRVGVCAFSGDMCVCSSRHPLIQALHDQYGEPLAKECGSVDNALSAVDHSVNKVLLWAESAEEAQGPVRSAVESIVGKSAAITSALQEMVEIVPLGNSKGRGVNLMFNSLGINTDETVAIGDGENDFEMLSFVDLGVAVHNAGEALKAHADVVLDRSHDNGAVADAIRRFVCSSSASNTDESYFDTILPP